MKVQSIVVVCGCLCVWGWTLQNVCAAEVKDEKAYRTQWLQTENVFGDEYDKVVQERERKRDIKLYLQMGKEYLDTKDIPAAIFCYKKIVELETGHPQEYTAEAKEYLARLEAAMERDVVVEISTQRKENFAKRRKGIQRILQRKPADLVMASDDPDAERRRQLEAELLKKRKAIEEEMHLKRLAFQVKKKEIDSMLEYAGELLGEGNYPESIAVCDKVLEIIPDSVVAHTIKNNALYAIEAQKSAIQRAKEEAEKALLTLQQEEEAARLRAEEERKRQEEEARQKKFQEFYTAAQQSYAAHQYRQAIDSVRQALEVIPDHAEAKVFLAEIRATVQKTMDELAASQSTEEARKAYEKMQQKKAEELAALKRAKEEELARLKREKEEELARLKRQKEEELAVLQQQKQAELSALNQAKEEEMKTSLAEMKRKNEEERARQLQTHIEAGKAYFQAQNYQEAIKEFKAALVLDPGATEIQQYLTEIKNILVDAKEALGDSPADSNPENKTETAPAVKKIPEKPADESAPASSGVSGPAPVSSTTGSTPVTDHFIATGDVDPAKASTTSIKKDPVPVQESAVVAPAQ